MTEVRKTLKPAASLPIPIVSGGEQKLTEAAMSTGQKEWNKTFGQMHFLETTSGRIGQTFNVATSQWATSVATSQWDDYVTTVNASSLRALETAGIIRIDEKFWRGAKVTRLK